MPPSPPGSMVLPPSPHGSIVLPPSPPGLVVSPPSPLGLVVPPVSGCLPIETEPSVLKSPQAVSNSIKGIINKIFFIIDYL